MLLPLFLGLWRVRERIRRQESFECGFEPFISSRASLSLKFYLVLLVFLVFDVEVVLIAPLLLSPLIRLRLNKAKA